ncbi:dihydrofolate reductase family protein, partial [Janibacter sp. G349]
MAPTPGLVTYSMNISLDGYIVGPDGGFDWSEPDEEVFAAHTDELRGVGVHLLGRRLHETMSYWETADQEPESDYSTVEWARMWRAVPKVVFSRTLTEVTGTNTRLATRSLAEEIAALRAESDEGEIALGGAELAAA